MTKARSNLSLILLKPEMKSKGTRRSTNFLPGVQINLYLKDTHFQNLIFQDLPAKRRRITTFLNKSQQLKMFIGGGNSGPYSTLFQELS